MAAHIGIINKHGLVTPDDGYAHETRKKTAFEWVKTKNEQGVTVEAEKLPYQKHDVTMRGHGRPDFGLIVAASAEDGEVLHTQVKESEQNKDGSNFEITGEVYENDSSGG